MRLSIDRKFEFIAYDSEHKVWIQGLVDKLISLQEEVTQFGVSVVLFRFYHSPP